MTVKLAQVPLDARKLSDDVKIEGKHFNKPQIRSMSVGANEEYAVWGRGTGKSEGLIAPKTFRNVDVMPRAHGCFVGSTYLQLLERTLPPVIKGWESMGWQRGRDFWIRERPPKHLNIPSPIVGPVVSDHCIFFKNGAVASMVSQDRPGSANGKTVHWIAGDEAKFLDKAKLDNELLMTNRGDERYFGGIPEFHSLLFCTDMPTSKAAMWILEEEKRMDRQRVELLLNIRVKIYELYGQLIAHPTKRVSIMKAIQKWQAQWDSIRAKCVFFSEASTLDNIHGFGADNIRRLREKLPAFIFNTAILNQRPFLTENAFYPDLDEHHFYDKEDHGYINSFNVEDFGKGLFNDSRKDADVDKTRPLDIGIDNGASINALLVGQPHGRTYRVLKELYVLHPERVVDLARAFCEYYRYHPCREVNYFYDHTAIGTSAVSNASPAEVFIDYLMEAGWIVNRHFIGATLDPEWRYELWGMCLRGGGDRLYKIAMNRHNCEYVRISMQSTQIAQGTTGFRKNKNDEKNHELDQRTTTHFSDAIDTLLVGAHLIHRFDDPIQFKAIFSN